ncbi:hypothetical protein [Mycolicibacterium grossiae]|uniref:DUF2613 domain-containing protein n=1 Tax=Mycolicibacterium grossiae TaxID=1552759 RepID=A0A1E8Q896_9MYCO|nr:hypothetical protein [Mycolicibacterium grossiae]OFJ54863.1 hypothetical protein BEL07_04680 [Mycolicibacterium grossiae]QEM44546.1 hypothetical protein FZ046_06875 [Mycolicibacterium grossiae]
MTTTARYFILPTLALPVLALAISGAAALVATGIANASTGPGGQDPTGPGYSYSPQTHAHPAPSAKPGWHGNHGPAYIAHLTGADQA